MKCRPILIREPDAAKPPVQFDERQLETARTAPPLDSTTPHLAVCREGKERLSRTIPAA